ncbi:Probable WRKY transcription factor 40 [Linum perenne]
MDYSPSIVDISLDLNLNPLRHLDDGPSSAAASRRKEWSFGVLPAPTASSSSTPSNFIELGMKVSPPSDDESKTTTTAGALVEELNRVSAENKKLTEMLTVMCENYNAMRNQLVDYMTRKEEDKENNGPSSPSRKRKSESSNTITNNLPINNNTNNGASESSSTDEESFKRPREEVIKAKISRVYVRTETSDSGLIVKDGYQWRKYGQKVTRDNPCPRAYFKCSFAPSCPVKKKVQRSVEDQSVVVATYEGEHNHPHPSAPEAATTSSPGSRGLAIPSSTSRVAASGPTIMAADLAKSKISPSSVRNVVPTRNVAATDPPRQAVGVEGPEVRQLLVEQMATSLSQDPNFTAALAAAISGKMLQQSHSQKW